MEENAKEKPTTVGDPKHRPPFTIIDWIVAAFSIALLIYVLINLPAY